MGFYFFAVVFLVYLKYKCFPDIQLADIFFHSVGCLFTLFTLLMASLTMQKLFNLVKSYLLL